MVKIFIYFSLLLCLYLSGYSQQSAGIPTHQVTENTFVYTTYRNIDGTLIPSNALYVTTEVGIVMIDTPWDTTLFQPLLDTMLRKHGQSPILCISTHFHTDRTCGVEFLNQKGVKTYASTHTLQLCKERNEKIPAFGFSKDTLFRCGDYTFRTYFPGPGHSPDNIVVWIDKAKLLYGGCLIKSTENNSPGNLEDASPSSWLKAMKLLQKKFPNPDYVIPGHYSWANPHSIKHTIQILRLYLRANSARK